MVACLVLNMHLSALYSLSKDKIFGARPDMNINLTAYVMTYLHYYTIHINQVVGLYEPAHAIFVLIAYTSIPCSDEPVQTRSLITSFTACSYNVDTG